MPYSLAAAPLLSLRVGRTELRAAAQPGAPQPSALRSGKPFPPSPHYLFFPFYPLICSPISPSPLFLYPLCPFITLFLFPTRSPILSLSHPLFPPFIPSCPVPLLPPPFPLAIPLFPPFSLPLPLFPPFPLPFPVPPFPLSLYPITFSPIPPVPLRHSPTHPLFPLAFPPSPHLPLSLLPSRPPFPPLQFPVFSPLPVTVPFPFPSPRHLSPSLPFPLSPWPVAFPRRFLFVPCPCRRSLSLTSPLFPIPFP